MSSKMTLFWIIVGIVSFVLIVKFFWQIIGVFVVLSLLLGGKLFKFKSRRKSLFGSLFKIDGRRGSARNKWKTDRRLNSAHMRMKGYKNSK